MQDITTFTTIWNCDGNFFFYMLNGNSLKFVIMWFLRILL